MAGPDIAAEPPRHYPETRKRGIPGEWTPHCPTCVIAWPCPQAIAASAASADSAPERTP